MFVLHSTYKDRLLKVCIIIITDKNYIRPKLTQYKQVCKYVPVVTGQQIAWCKFCTYNMSTPKKKIQPAED